MAEEGRGRRGSVSSYQFVVILKSAYMHDLTELEWKPLPKLDAVRRSELALASSLQVAKGVALKEGLDMIVQGGT